MYSFDIYWFPSAPSGRREEISMCHQNPPHPESDAKMSDAVSAQGLGFWVWVWGLGCRV